MQPITHAPVRRDRRSCQEIVSSLPFEVNGTGAGRLLVVYRTMEERAEWREAVSRVPGLYAEARCVHFSCAAGIKQDIWETVVFDMRHTEKDEADVMPAVKHLHSGNRLVVCRELEKGKPGAAPVTVTFGKEKEDAAGNTVQSVRTRLQNDAVMRLFHEHRLIVNWGTGTGKSRVGFRVAKSLIDNGRGRVLLLVAESAHKENWKREFIDAAGKEEGESLFKKLTVECYASLPKYPNTEWDCIIADEAHHLRSDIRSDLLRTIKTDYFLCLTATMNDGGDANNLMQVLNETYGTFASVNFSLQDSIDNKILGEPVIYVHRLSLEKISTPQQLTLEWGMKDYRKLVNVDVAGYRAMIKAREDARLANKPMPYKHIKAVITGSAKELYDLIDEELATIKASIDAYETEAFATTDQWKKNSLMKRAESLKLQLKLYGNKRKQLLGASKTRFAGWLLRQIEKRGKKYVCFCNDIPQAEELGANSVIHSKRKGKDDTIEKFNSGELTSLFAIGMIQEGQNLAGIEAGVIIQLSGKERKFIQELGRTMRAKEPEQHVIVFRDTRDDFYYENSLGDINPKYLRIKEW